MTTGVSLLGIAIALGVILLSMILHELAHGVMALALGDTTAKDDGRLTLNPLKHLDPVLSVALPLVLYLMGGPVFGGAKPVPVDSRNLKGGAWGMALVAIVGPLTNFILAFVGFLIAYGCGVFSLVDGTLMVTNDVAGQIWSQFVSINLGFGIFNLIPIPPLDGSRVIYALAPDGARNFLQMMEKYGFVIVLILVMVGSTVLNKIMVGGMQGMLDFFCWVVG